MEHTCLICRNPSEQPNICNKCLGISKDVIKITVKHVRIKKDKLIDEERREKDEKVKRVALQKKRLKRVEKYHCRIDPNPPPYVHETLQEVLDGIVKPG